MSGVDYNGTRLRKGAGDAILALGRRRGRPGAARAAGRRSTASRREGGTPLAVARDSQVLGVIYLKDIVKEGMRHRFDRLRAMGIRTSWSPATTG